MAPLSCHLRAGRLRAPRCLSARPSGVRAQHSNRSRNVTVRADGGKDAARKALQDMFAGTKDILASNDSTDAAGGGGGGDRKGGGGGSGGGGGGDGTGDEAGGFSNPFSGWSVAAFRAGLAEWRANNEALLKFLPGAIILYNVPRICEYAAMVVMYVLVQLKIKEPPKRWTRKKVSRQRPEMTTSGKKGELGRDEAELIAKYGADSDGSK